MTVIIDSFAQFLPYIFVIVVVGLVWDNVVSAFQGRFK